METNQNDKKTKSNKPAAHGAIRVRKETRKRVLAELAKVNKKDFGKKVHMDELIVLAVSRITPEDVLSLQEQSLSHADRLERDYRAYVAENGHISKDIYLGKRLTGAIFLSPEHIATNKNQQK
jgi:hypothetical protein